MIRAKYYTYSNLNKGTSFSTKQRGIVVFRECEPTLVVDGVFSVSEAGRLRCLREGARNVHAYLVSDAPPSRLTTPLDMPALDEVKYNPYVGSSFINTSDNTPIFKANKIYLLGGRCFVERK